VHEKTLFISFSALQTVKQTKLLMQINLVGLLYYLTQWVFIEKHLFLEFSYKRTTIANNFQVNYNKQNQQCNFFLNLLVQVAEKKDY
jgi:hypothetical protein